MAVLYFTGEDSLPSGKIPDGIFLQAQECAFAPGSRFLPFGAVPLKQKQRSAFLILAQAKQFACFPTKLKPRLRGVLNFGRNRIRTYVGRSPTVLQTVAFDRSAILPNKLLLYLNN